jgi:uncharacterized membrane protein
MLVISHDQLWRCFHGLAGNFVTWILSADARYFFVNALALIESSHSV